jgi:hypothetical protein
VDIALQNAACFEESDVVKTLVTRLLHRDTHEGKKLKLAILSPIIQGSAKCAKDFLDLDGILIIKEQITQHFDPIF